MFDELIRQVTINEPERGKILARYRDDIRQTKVAYKTLYQSAVNFAQRKQMQAESTLSTVELTKECTELQNKVFELK